MQNYLTDSLYTMHFYKLLNTQMLVPHATIVFGAINYYHHASYHAYFDFQYGLHSFSLILLMSYSC